ncbi:MAG: hypothetical protein AAF726_11650 [Planctomycetota bacterium]
MLVVVPLLLAAPLQDAPLATPETLDALVEQVVPSDEELAWRAIPWRPTLYDGLSDGAASDKPVLLWAMNGHPLGST